MRKVTSSLLAFLFLALFTFTSFAQGWYQQQISSTGSPGGIFFINADTGWVSFTDGFFGTTNGGATWALLTSSQVYYQHFSDANNGWARSNTSLIRTSNGGKNWQNVPSPLLGQMRFFGTDTIYVFNSGRFARTVDGGQNWYNTSVDVVAANTFYFPNSRLGYIGGTKVAWSNNPPPTKGTFGAFFCNTKDGGLTWTQQYCHLQEDIVDIYALDSNTLFANGSHNLVRSANGGINWDTVVGNPAAFDFFFLSKQIGYIADGQGAIWFTNDSGKTWLIQDSIPTELDYIFFIDSLNGWAAGDSGIVLHTTTGGKLWVRQYLPRPLEIHTIPEPFTTKTTLSYSIPKAASVDMKLYDVLGKEVYHITSDGIQTEGEHSIEIHGENLPGGVYYFILTAGSFNGMGKVTKIVP